MTEERVPYLNENREQSTLTIRDDGGDLRKYRIELPNLIDDLDLSLYAFRLYVHLKRVAGANGACFQSTKTLAKHCRMSIGKISEAKKELADKGLINVEQRQREKGETDLITIYDMWPQNFAAYRKDEGENRVHVVNTPPPLHEQGVHHMNGGVHVAEREEGTNIKKEPNKNKPNEEVSAAAQPAPKPSDHPAVKAYREIVERFPSKAQMKMIAETDPPIGNWIRAVKTWIGRGHKPINIEGMLEWALNPALMERFSGNTNSKETMRNGREADNGQHVGPDENGRGWYPGEIERIQQLEREGRGDEALDLIRAANARVRKVR